MSGKAASYGLLSETKACENNIRAKYFAPTFRTKKLAPRMHSETSAPVTSLLEPSPQNQEIEQDVSLPVGPIKAQQAGKTPHLQHTNPARNLAI